MKKTLEYIYEQFIGIDTNYENLILLMSQFGQLELGVTATNDDIKNVHNAIKSKMKNHFYMVEVLKLKM